MRVKGFSLPVIIITFILTLGILFSVNWVYTEMAIKKPLGQQLSEVKGVKGYTIENGPETMELTVELGLVDNIETSYMSLNEIAYSHVKNNQGYEIRIIDNPNSQLITLWNEIQYYAYQSLVQGDFVTLKESLDDIVKVNENVNYQVHINETHLFIQVQSHENYIYRILQRTN
ncbi:MAG: hypothetical protein KGZ94_02410 [Clostridia bacterium]|nr:hypothetical protein [Clostridia bacterium]